jgi:ATP-dependent Clp protease ATP-binding subunit ClpC
MPGFFDRYTEEARRAIFFARFEASRYSSEEIDDIQVLLGVLTADPALAWQLQQLGFSVEAIRAELAPGDKTVATSVDLPLSSVAQRVLITVGVEADRANSTTIKAGHLLTAIAGVESSRAAEMLAASGLTQGRLRDIVSSS